MAALHVQSRVVETATVPLPPTEGKSGGGALGIAIWHFESDADVREVEVDALLQCAQTPAEISNAAIARASL